MRRIREARKRVLGATAIGVLALLAALPGPTAEAGTVYLLDDGPDRILTVDSSTGAILNSYAAPAPFGQIAGLSLAESGRSLIFTDDQTSPLFRINPATGAVLSSHPLNTFLRGGLSFQGNTILAINNGFPLVRQVGFGGPTSPAPVPTVPGPPGALGGDDTGRHFLWGFAPLTGNAIVETDLTGAILANLGNATQLTLSGLAFDGANLYAVGLGSRTLYTLDPTTGAIRNTALVAGRGDLVGAAAGAIVPLPAAAWMGFAGLALVGLLSRRRRENH